MKIFIASLFLFLLLVMALIDGKTRKIPDRSIGALIIIGIVMFFVFPEIGLSERISGAFCISVPLLFINLLIPGSFGGGDIKLAGSSGMVLGLQGAVSASLIGLVLFLGYVYLQKRADGKEKGFPLCPFLCFGAAVIYCLQTGGWMR